MNVAVETKPTGTAIRTLVEANPVLVLIEPDKFEPFFEAIKSEVMAHVPDLTSKKGRDAIRSLASDVTRTKTAIDAAGKKLNETARAQINKVDASRRAAWARLEDLSDTVRKPLTDWEVAEEQRISNCKAMIQRIEDCGRGLIGGAQQPFAVLFHELEEKIVIDASFGEFEGEANKVKAAAIERLTTAFKAYERAEADRIELERLRAEKAERDRIDAEKKAADDKKRRDAEAAEAAERRRLEAEVAEQERIATAERRAQEQATAAAERKAREEREEQDRRHAAELQAEKDKAAEAERLRQAEIDRLAREEAARVAEAKRLADEDAARARDKAHRAKVEREVQEALLTVFEGFGVSDKLQLAERIVDAIVCGDVPHTSIRF